MPYCENIECYMDSCNDCPWFNKKSFKCDIMYFNEKHTNDKHTIGGRLSSWVRRRVARAAASKSDTKEL